MSNSSTWVYEVASGLEASYTMPTISITGPARSGKTSLAAALLARAGGAGSSAAYAKPFSSAPDSDADHEFAMETLAVALGIAVGPKPQPLSTGADSATGILSGLRNLADTVIVELAEGARHADPAIASDTSILEIVPYSPCRDWAGVADEAAVRWGSRLASLVINGVPPYRQEAVATSVAESSAEVQAVVIPESRVMLAPTVAQIANHLDAVWTLDPINADATVERFLIGGNIMDSGPTYYGRYANQAVITRTQRPDIQLASMLPQTRCLVLTGPGDPTEYVRVEALERDIPLLQVFASTIETADALDRIIDSSTAHSLAKARHYAALLEQHAGTELLDGWLQ